MNESVLLEKIRQDGGTQSRAEIHGGTVARYVEAYSEADEMPPPVVYFDGDQFWLADGFHRVRAAQQLGLVQLDCDVRQGSLRDAILHSVGANARHGLPRTNNDKRRAVERLLRDEEWARCSDRWIAEKCAVSRPLVAEMRAELQQQVAELPPEPERRVGKDGKAYSVVSQQVAELPPEPELSFLTCGESGPRALTVRDRKPEPEEVFTVEQRRLLDQTLAELANIEDFGRLTPQQHDAIARLHSRCRLLTERDADGGEWKILLDDALSLYTSIDPEQVDAGDELAVEALKAAQTSQEPIGAVDTRIAELEAALEQAYADTEAARTEALENGLRLQNAVKANEQLRALVADLDAKLKAAQEAQAKAHPRPVMSFRSFVLEFALLDRQTREDIAAYVIEKAPGMAAKASRYDADRDSDYRGEFDTTPLACMCVHVRTHAPAHARSHVSESHELVVHGVTSESRDSGVGGVGEEPKGGKRPARKSARKAAADPRSAHPAIIAVLGIIGRYPSRELYDTFIEVLGDEPDLDRLAACRKEWLLRGFSPANFGWLTDWYRTGVIPTRRQPVTSNGGLVSDGNGGFKNTAELNYEHNMRILGLTV